jgi:hypothetical protein
LGAILEFPTFWEMSYYEIHKLTAIKLLRKISSSAKEVGVDSGLRNEEEESGFFSDIEGLELITGSMLLGVKSWLESIDEMAIDSQEWFGVFQKLLELLVRYICSRISLAITMPNSAYSRPEARTLLPKSWERATGDFYRYTRGQWKCKLDGPDNQ